MKIFVNGCSHTRGTAECLDNNPKAAWPYRLQKLLGASEVVNKSLEGHGNDRIIRSTVEDIILDPTPPDLAIIQLSHLDRFEVPHNSELAFTSMLPLTFLRGHDFSHSPNSIETKFCEKYFDFINKKNISSTLEDKFLIQIVTLINFFENQDIDYILMCWDDWQSNNFHDRLWKLIDTTKVVNYHNDGVQPMNHILKSHGFKLSKKIRPDGSIDNHFQSDAHEYIAQSIFNFIKTGRKMVPSNINKIYDRDYEEAVNHYG